MIGKLYMYFGIVGLASIVAWIGAVVMFAGYARHKRRTFFYVRALCVALVAWLLAYANSCNVSLIQVDRSQEMKEAMERQLRARAAEMKALQERAADIHFAEDDKYEYYDLAGVESDEKKSIYERAAEGQDVEYLYRKAGKKRRDSGGRDQASAPDKSDLAEEEDRAAEPKKPRGKVLLERDRVHATRLAGINLRMSGIVFVFALCLLVVDYFSRFNKTFGFVLPLPLSGRTVDHLFSKKHSALLRAGEPYLARAYLESVVRKGESFLYFGRRDISAGLNLARVHIPVRVMWHDFIEVIRPAGVIAAVSRVSRLPRLSVAGRPLRDWLRVPGVLRFWNRFPRLVTGITSVLRRIWIFIRRPFAWVGARVKRFLRWTRLVIGIKLVLRKTWIFVKQAFILGAGLVRWFVRWALSVVRLRDRVGAIRFLRDGALDFHPVPVITLTSEHKPCSHNFVFESVWFGRYSFIIDGPELSSSMVASLQDFLGERYRPHAAAWRTVHILWDMENALSQEVLESLVFFATQANFKLILFSPDPHNASFRTLVEEVCPNEPPAQVA